MKARIPKDGAGVTVNVKPLNIIGGVCRISIINLRQQNVPLEL